MAKKIGRPTKYTNELAEQICSLIAQGKTTLAVSKIVGIERHTIVDWVRKNPEFSTMYAEARQFLYEHWADEIIEDSHNENRDYQQRVRKKTSEKGIEITEEVVSDNTAVQRDRLKVDSKKWLLSKLLPREYGDKLINEHTGKDGEPLVPVLNITIAKPNGGSSN